MEQFRTVMEWTGMIVDSAGVAVVVIGAIVATARFFARRGPSAYRRYREDLGRAILLGLEFLVAGDIIRTVVVAPTLENAFTLAVIVLIRTTLSTALQMELEGRWPWQKGARDRIGADQR